MTPFTPELRPATPDDARSLAPLLRLQDVAEITASSGLSPVSSLLRGVEMSEWSYAVELGGEVAALFGVVSMPPESAANRVGVPWMLASPLLFRHIKALSLHRHAMKWIGRMHADYDYLLNVVDCRNTASIQWLSSLGFEFMDLHPRYGAGKLPFIQFERCRDV